MAAADTGDRAAAGYLALQAVLAVVWWWALAVAPAVRSRFELVPGHHEALDAFLFADVVIFVGGSALSAWALWRATSWTVPVLAFTAGGTTYATVTLAGYYLFTGTGAVGLGAMVAATAITVAIAARVALRAGSPHRERTP